MSFCSVLSKLCIFLVSAHAVLFLAIGRPLSAETFRNPYRIPLTSDPASVLVADINSDGHSDILYFLSGSTTLQILLGSGSGYVAGQSVNFVGPLSRIPICVLSDVNHDSKQDLVCTAPYEFTDNIDVFLGNGDGTFQSPIVTSVSTQSNGSWVVPNIFAVGDLNNDGFADFVVEEEQSQETQVLLSDGHGGFKTPIVLPYGFFSTVPFVTDINHDGIPDLINPNGGVFLGKGDGTFSSPKASFSSYPYGLTCTYHDMDGDGQLDAVCGAIETQTGDITGGIDLTIFHGNGDGTFNPTPILIKVFGDHDTEYDGYGTFNFPIAVVDLNGDGIPDILATSDDGLAVLLGGPGLTFSTPLHYANSVVGYSSGVPLPTQSQLADMNGDGLPDLVSVGPNGIYILYANSNGSYASAFAPEVTEVIGYATMADFNGDGIPDVVATGDTAIKLSLGKGDGTFATATALSRGASNIDFSTPLSATSAHIVHGDFNGDGKQDLLAIGSSSIYQYNYYILFGHGDGTFDAPLLVPNSSTIYPMYSQVVDTAVADLNHDGRSDLISITTSTYMSGAPSAIYASLSNGDGSFTTITTTVPTDGQTYSLVPPTLAEFSKSGNLDAAYATTTNLHVLKGHGDGSFDTTGVTLPIPNVSNISPLGALAITSGDFDGDGNQDVAVLMQYGAGQFPYPSAFATAAWVYYGNGDGTFVSTPVLIGTFDRIYTGIVAADLNRDGLSDLVLKTGGTLSGGESVGVINAQAGRTFGPEVNYTAGTGLSSLSIADVNLDGFPDLVFANGDFNIRASSVTVLLNLGNIPVVSGTLNASPEPSVFAQPFQITASLVPPAVGPALAGNVTFSVDGTSIGAAALSGNTAIIAGPITLSVGTHQLTATWPGNSAYPAVTLQGTHNVLANPTAATLTSSLNPSAFSQSVTFTATVTSSNGTPTGSITFADGATALQTVPLSTGAASFTTSALTVGTHTITATYVPTGSFATSTGSLSQRVTGLASTSVLTASPTTAVYDGAPITLTATIAAATPPGPGTPTGSVTFIVDGVSATPQTLASGLATLSLTSLNGGLHTFGCTYSGDTTYSSSTCNAASATITPAPTNFGGQIQPVPAFAFQPISFQLILNISSYLGGNGRPVPGPDNVTLSYGLASATPTVIPLVTNSSGIAIYNLSAGLAPGTYTVTFAFAGNANLQSVSQSTTLLVTDDATGTTLTASPNPAALAQTVTLTATVGSVGPTATGSVTFLDAGTPIGSAQLNSAGVATFTTTQLALGTHPLTASYPPTGSFNGSTSLVVNEVIVQSGFNLTLSPNTLTLQAGKQGSTTVQLSSVGVFSGPLTLSFGPLPQYATGSFSAPTVTLAAGSNASSTFTLQTSMLAANSIPQRPGSRTAPITLCALLMLLPLALRRSRLRSLLIIGAAVIFLQTLTGCTTIRTPFEFVAGGTYQIPITATDVNKNTSTQTLTLIVTP